MTIGRTVVPLSNSDLTVGANKCTLYLAILILSRMLGLIPTNQTNFVQLNSFLTLTYLLLKPNFKNQ